MKRIAAAAGLAVALVWCTTALAAAALSGTYSATIGRAPLGGALNGTWSLTFSGSKYTITFNGAVAVNGILTQKGNKLTFADKSGKYACPGKGVYDYTLTGRTLTFKRVSESSAKCAGRRVVLGATFTKKLSLPSRSGY